MATAHDTYVVCPHCGEQHGDAWEWCTGVQETECDGCGKTFLCWPEYDVTYHAETREENKALIR